MARAKKADALVTSAERKEATALEELGDFFDAVSTDGMEDVNGEDIKLAVKVFNLGGVDSNGNARRKNVFFDNITEEEQDSIDCVLLLTQKTHRWDSFDNAAKETNIICDSRDRVTGLFRESGEQRSCHGCPDRGWFKNPETGEPLRKCGEVHNVVAVETASQRPFLVRFKKTGLKPFRNYLMQHHFGARQKADGTRGNVPLFAYSCTLSLTMHESGNYALPVLVRGSVLSRDDVMRMHESAKGYHELMGAVMQQADAAEVTNDTTQLSSDDFAD